MAASKLFCQVSGVTWTPLPSGTAITIDKATDVSHQRGGKPIKFYGDGIPFPSAVKVVERERTVSVQTGNKKAVFDIPEDTAGTLVWIEQDFQNGTGTGARTYTLSPCKMLNDKHDGKENTPGMGTLNFAGYSADGTTDPLTVVEAA